ncbi:MAG: DUF4440 domain-containing protein [Gemmataceae bacterium]
MSRRFAAVALALAAGWAVARSDRSPDAARPDLKAELMAADRAFAKVTAEKGLDGWLSAFADDAVRVAPLGGKAHVGKAAVKELDAKLFADPARRLVWEPTDAGAFADPNYGFTTGRAKFLAKQADGTEQVVGTTAYVTWWRKDASGTWKVILDTGAETPAKP